MRKPDNAGRGRHLSICRIDAPKIPIYHRSGVRSGATEIAIEFLSKNNLPHCVVLVHGTWGGDSIWAHANSGWIERLTSQLAEPADIARFSWNGRNRQSARLSASDELANCISSDLKRYQTIHLIGHSHGGNVATRAASRSRKPVNSIVTLATPYIVSDSYTDNMVEERAIYFLFAVLMIATIVAIPYVAPYFPAIFPPNPAPQEVFPHPRERETRWIGELVAVSVLFIALGIYWAVKGLLDRIRSRIANRYNGFGINTVPVLALYYAKDEAFKVLRHSTGLQATLRRISDALPNWSDVAIDSSLKGGLLRSALMSSLILAIPTIVYALWIKGNFWISAVAGMVLLLPLAIIALKLANALTPIWTGAASLGIDCWVDMLFARIRIGRVPVGSAPVKKCELAFDHAFVSTKSRLAHSDICHDSRAMDLSIEWISANGITGPRLLT